MSRIKQLFCSFFIIILISIACSDIEKPITIYMIGDSTMANKKNPDVNPEFGWGQVFHEFFNNKVTVDNRARNGRSSKSFISEGLWDSVKKNLQPGDYVFIQFGHNDQKVYDPNRYTNPVTGYRHNLEKFVSESKVKGAHPIVLSSIVRRHFNSHGTLIDTHGLYPLIAREVAEENHIPFIDLQWKTDSVVSQLGPDSSKCLYMFIKPGEFDMYPEGRQDSTHLRYIGAKKVAEMAAMEIERQNLDLAKYLKKE